MTTTPQESMNILAGTTDEETIVAANTLAGLTGQPLIVALNEINGTAAAPLPFRAVCNALAGTTGMDGTGALSLLAESGPWSTNDAFMTAVLATTPWGLWGLDEASGNGLDLSGNAHDITWAGTIAERQATGTVPAVPARTGMRTNGATGAVIGTATYAEARGTISLMASVKFTDDHSGAFGNVITIGNNALSLFQQKLWMIWENDATSTGSGSYGANIDDGAAHLLVITMGLGLYKVWIDGTLITSTTSTGMDASAPIAGDVKVLGRSTAPGGAAGYVTGTSGPVAVWNKALTNEDVAAIYAAWAA